ncbi:Pyridoxal kinase [Microbacterium esteraromaticum]|uniref:pyridoxal kinase n=1 Tax=Microbacterium esteraromaticum TaxID=57043 RepID=A0A1R4J224_9MICO|nr:PfkB family carbohydrate kinase [Microbacterium esteraromaticum]SJN25805.1 Pyridoxal kinase [Microbacterium esteraromaticum]
MSTASKPDWAHGRARWELDRRPAEVLLIGSQVAFGSVGMNGVLPMLSGVRVVPLPTIVLSNLPHYPSVHATPLPAEWLAGSIRDLEALGALDEIDSVCTGYFASPEQVHAVADALEPLLARRPDLRVLVDPTLGDSDVGMYTDPAVAPALRERMLPLATGVVPNGFELGLLSGADASADAEAAARGLLGPRTEWIVISGGAATGGPTLVDVVVTREDATRLEHPLIPTTVKGTGDAFAGAVLAELRRGAAVTDAVDAAAVAVRSLLA